MIRKKILDPEPVKGQYKTFKLPLKSIINQSQVPKIEEIVLKLNDLVIHTYQFIRLYSLYCFHCGYPHEITSEFIRYSMTVLGSFTKRLNPPANKGLYKKMEWFYQYEYQPNTGHVKPNIDNYSHFLMDLAIQIETCISNNIQERFIVHFKRFVNETTKGFEKGEVHKLKDCILNLKLNEINPIFSNWGFNSR